MNTIEKVYVKKRSEFGKFPNFSDYDQIEEDLKSDPKLMKNFMRIDPVSRGTQTEKSYALHEVT